MYSVYTSQLETLPGKRDKFFHMSRTKSFGESKYFLANRDNFFPYEQALSLDILNPNNANVSFDSDTLFYQLKESNNN